MSSFGYYCSFDDRKISRTSIFTSHLHSTQIVQFLEKCDTYQRHSSNSLIDLQGDREIEFEDYLEIFGVLDDPIQQSAFLSPFFFFYLRVIS